MNRESFLDTLKQQYANEIHEAYLESEHEGTVDFQALTRKLSQLMKSAKVEGLQPRDFEDLIRTTLPDTAGKVDLVRLAKKAA